MTGAETRGVRRAYAGRVAAALVALAVAVASAYAADEPSTLTGGSSVTGPPAPAVPAVAATPEPAAQPAVPGAPVEPGVAARAEPIAPPAPAAPRSVKLWPFFEYESGPAAQTRHVRIFGPLLEYRSDPDRQSFAFRPFVSISQSRRGHDDDVRILGPLLTSHWGQTDQVTKGFGGFFTYRTRTSEDGRTLESQRARLLPLYAYEWDRPEPSGRLSVAPFYADVGDVLGYERIEMVMFPAYLHVQRPALDRRYYLFPLISRDGEPGSGYRLWPFPLRDRQGRPLARELRDDAPPDERS